MQKIKDKKQEFFFLVGLLLTAFVLLSPTFCGPLSGLAEEWHNTVYAMDLGVESLITFSDSGIQNMFAACLGYAVTIYNGLLRNLGIALMLMYWMIYIFQTTSSMQQIGMELIIKSGIRLVIGVFFIFQAMTILCGTGGTGGILGFINSLINDIAAMSNTTPGTGTIPSYADMNINGLFPELAYIISLLIPFFGMQLVSLFAKFLVYSRLFDIILRIMWAPFAMGDIFSGGENANAIRWVRSFMASCLAGAIMVAVLQLYTFAISSGGAVANAWNALLLAFICAASLAKANTFAREICGV